MNKKRLQVEQLDRKLQPFAAASKVTPPPTGWVKAIRLSLGLSLQQLGDKLGITKQSVGELERREQEGSITLNSMKEAANALDMELVYAVVPKDGSLDALIERKAREMAVRIVSRTSKQMQLEDQENAPSRIQKAIEERTAILKSEMPKAIWD